MSNICSRWVCRRSWPGGGGAKGTRRGVEVPMDIDVVMVRLHWTALSWPRSCSGARPHIVPFGPNGCGGVRAPCAWCPAVELCRTLHTVVLAAVGGDPWVGAGVVLAKHVGDVRMGRAHFTCAACRGSGPGCLFSRVFRLWVPLGFVVNEATRDAMFEQRAAPVSFRAASRRYLLLSCLRSHCG